MQYAKAMGVLLGDGWAVFILMDPTKVAPSFILNDEEEFGDKWTYSHSKTHYWGISHFYKRLEGSDGEKGGIFI